MLLLKNIARYHGSVGQSLASLPVNQVVSRFEVNTAARDRCLP